MRVLDLDAALSAGVFRASSIYSYDGRVGVDQSTDAKSTTRLSSGTNIVHFEIPIFGMNAAEAAVNTGWFSTFLAGEGLNSMSLADLKATVTSEKLFVNDIDISHLLVENSEHEGGSAPEDAPWGVYLKYSAQIFPLWQLDVIDCLGTVAKSYTFRLEITFKKNIEWKADYTKSLLPPLAGNTIRLQKRAPEMAESIEILKRYFPEDTRARAHPFSVTKQLLNPFGLELDQMRVFGLRQTRSLSMSGARADEADWLYTCFLDTEAGEAFSKVIDEEGYEASLAPKSVVGKIGYNEIEVHYTETPREMLYSNPPTRITVEKVADNVRGYLSASTPLGQLELLPEIALSTPSRVYVKLHSASGLVAVDRIEEKVTATSIRLVGSDVVGNPQAERMMLLEEGVYRTKKIFKSFSAQLSTSGTAVSGEVIFMSAPLEGGYTREAFAERLRDGNELIPVEWGLEKLELPQAAQAALTPDPTVFKTREAGHASLLTIKNTRRNPSLDILRGMDSGYIEKRYVLLDVNAGVAGVTAGAKTLISGMGLCGNPEKPDLYLIDQTHLYILPKRGAMPGVLSVAADGRKTPFASILNDQTILPEISFVIEEINEPEITYDEASATPRIDYKVDIGLNPPRDTQTVKRWSWSYYEADGTQIFLDADREQAPAEYWIDNTLPFDYFGIQDRDFEFTFSLKLNDLGRFLDPTLKNIRHHIIVRLDVILSDETREICFQSLEFPIKQATASYRFATPWAEEEDLRSSAGIIGPEAYRLQPRVTHGDTDAEEVGSVSFEVSGAYRDIALMFDPLGDGLPSVFVSNSSSYTAYTVAQKTAANTAPAFSALYRIHFHRDYYTCDFVRGEILMAEKYDSVKVVLEE